MFAAMLQTKLKHNNAVACTDIEMVVRLEEALDALGVRVLRIEREREGKFSEALSGWSITGLAWDKDHGIVRCVWDDPDHYLITRFEEEEFLRRAAIK